jgi:hypothetical protein
MIQKVKDKKWMDEAGLEVPVGYIATGVRMKERAASTLLKEAKSVNLKLKAFKELMNKLCDGIYAKAMDDYKVKSSNKGNFTWFNFDRSIKIEVSISDRIDFDDLAIKASKEKLDAFLSENLDSKTEFVKDLVIDAFSTTKGKIDAKKVMSLMKYRTKIKHPLFQQALDILTQGIQKPESKTYFRIWERDTAGKYNLIDLNFSSI